MDGQNWLLLTDYASKHRISVSTLRRRIKSHQIPFRFENGKYLLLDNDSESAEQNSEKNIGSIMSKTENITSDVRTQPAYSIPMNSLDFTESKSAENKSEEAKDASSFSAATKLLNEMKRAYSQQLHEKDQQMINLKREISDLKTLVRVLEEDNDRMRSLLGFKIPNT
jgi:hypothetical protein